jgi:hypothetical protein
MEGHHKDGMDAVEVEEVVMGGSPSETRDISAACEKIRRQRKRCVIKRGG